MSSSFVEVDIYKRSGQMILRLREMRARIPLGH
jgi:hypothetical protein